MKTEGDYSFRFRLSVRHIKILSCQRILFACRVAENEQLLVVILNLLESMISPVPLIAAVAYEQVCQYTILPLSY